MKTCASRDPQSLRPNLLPALLRHAFLLALLGLVACGGGGDTGSSSGSGGSGSSGGGSSGGGTGGGTAGQPYIIATLIAFPTGAAPPGFVDTGYNSIAEVQITNQSGGAPITTATVSVNGIALPYFTQSQEYAAELSVNPGAMVTLNVTVNGATYTASRTQFSAYPSITAPAANTNWSLQAPNLISWTGTAPDTTSVYALGVVDPNGNLLWPSGGSLQTAPTTQNSYAVGANSLTAGSRQVLVGIVDVQDLPGSAPGSGFLLGGFNYAPITVTGVTLTLQSIATTPATVTLGPGTSSQLAATGTFSDGSTQDLTTQATWSSSDTSKVTVNATGQITGVAPGTAHVTADDSGHSSDTIVTVFQANPSPVPPLSQAVTYQIDYAHSGRATFGSSGPTFPPSATWSTTLNGQISYPLIAAGKVFVITNTDTASPPPGYGTSLYGLDEATGNVVWGPIALSGTYSWSAHAYDHGTLFVVNFDGLLRSFDAATGTPGWSKQLPYQYAFSAAPTAVNGIVYLGGAGTGGTVYAVDELTGNVLWTAGVENGDNSSPTVSADGVFVSYPCQVYKLDPLTGTTLWHYAGPCEGGGGSTAAYANNQLFVRDYASNPPDQVFDAGTGTQLGTFTSSAIPAFSGQTALFLSDSGTLTAIDQTTHNTLWTFMGDGGLVSAPIAIDSAVVVGSSSGTVYALDASNGHVLWSGSAGGSISIHNEGASIMPLTGLGAGEGYLVVPAGNVLTGWRLKP